MDDRAAALDALARWKAQRSWARADPGSLAIAKVEPVGPVQVVLTSVYEARGVRYRLEAAPSRPSLNEPGPDPWAIDIPLPADPPVGHEASAVVPGVRVHMDCGLCSGMGDMTCTRCDGAGRIQHGKHSQACFQCNGRGHVQCPQCVGSGGLYGHPTAWARIEECQVIRVHESDELPNAVFLALNEGDHGGETMHEQRGAHIEDLVRQGGYRDAAGSSDPLRVLVRKLCEHPGVPDGGRVLHQHLRLSRVAAWEVGLENGSTLWVFGDPPRVSPAGALPSTTLRVAKVVPAVVAAGAAAFAAYWLLGR
ncbi:MAG: hypothetical protein JJ863_38880 [Deltaproteobacteria bacterium]|nr:hypothetical protein [Deltaproteobacteria bacterium]